MRRIAVAILALAGVLVAVAALLFVWVVLGTSRAERDMSATEAWAAKVEPELARVEGVGYITIRLPKRYYGFKPPSWFVLVNGVVLDAAAEKRVHDAFNAAGPPDASRVRWWVADCGGDRECIARALAEAEKDAGR